MYAETAYSRRIPMVENRGFRGLLAWQVGMEVVELIYQ